MPEINKNKSNTCEKIPKILHYCWFGDAKKNKLIKKCIKSWHKILPDYKIREWNDNDLKECNNQYVQEAYMNKKYAFISDYFRLYALYNYGGVYLDSDNEILKPLDDFLNLEFFSGYENWNGIIKPFTALVGAKPNNKIIKDLLDEYESIHFIEDNKLNMKTNTRRVSEYFEHNYGLSKPYDGEHITILQDKCILYPYKYFCNYEKNVSYAIHHFNASWKNKSKMSFIETIFSIKNVNSHKQVTILGIKIKFKRKHKTNITVERE